MDHATELTQLARERADRRIDAALAKVREAMTAIAKAERIPDGVQGHLPEDLLGRIANVPSMSRELRRALAQALAKQELEAMIERQGPPKAEPKTTIKHADPQRPIKAGKAIEAQTTPAGTALEDLTGVAPQVTRALRAGGFRTVEDLASVPDEHLLKVGGIGERSVQQLREAISKLSSAA